MSFVDNVLTPLLKTGIYVAVFGTLAIIFIRFFFIKWTREWKWTYKYKILRRKIEEKDKNWVIEMLNHNKNVYDVKRIMLLNNQTRDRVFEMMYIFMQVGKIMKGGNKKDGREFERNNSKTKITAGTELPSV